MASFGPFETDQFIGCGPFGPVLAARAKGDEQALALKLCQPPALGRIKDAYFTVGCFEQQARLLEQLTQADAPHWAPLRARGRVLAGAYYVTDRYDHSLRLWIESRTRASSRAISAVVGAILDGLAALNDVAARPHANLTPQNVLLSGDPTSDEAKIDLTDPLPSSLARPHHDQKYDLVSLGKLTYAVVTHHYPSGPVPLPVEPSGDWSRLGKHGSGWCSFVNDLLRPADQGGLATLDDARARFEAIRWRPRSKVPLYAGGGALAAAIVAAVFLPAMLRAPEPPRECPRDDNAWARWCFAMGEGSWFRKLSDLVIDDPSSEIASTLAGIDPQSDLLTRIRSTTGQGESDSPLIIEPGAILPEALANRDDLFFSPKNEEFLLAIEAPDWCSVQDASALIDETRRAIDAFVRDANALRQQMTANGLNGVAAFLKQQIDRVVEEVRPELDETATEELAQQTPDAAGGEAQADGSEALPEQQAVRTSLDPDLAQRFFKLSRLPSLYAAVNSPALSEIGQRHDSIVAITQTLKQAVGQSDPLIDALPELLRAASEPDIQSADDLDAIATHLTALDGVLGRMQALAVSNEAPVDFDRFRAEGEAYAQLAGNNTRQAIETWITELPLYQIVTDDPRTDMASWSNELSQIAKPLTEIRVYDAAEADDFENTINETRQSIQKALSAGTLVRKDVAILDRMTEQVRTLGVDIDDRLAYFTGKRDEFLASLETQRDQQPFTIAATNDTWRQWVGAKRTDLGNRSFRIDTEQKQVDGVRAALEAIESSRTAPFAGDSGPKTLNGQLATRLESLREQHRLDQIQDTLKQHADSLETLPIEAQSQGSLWSKYDAWVTDTEKLLADISLVEQALACGYQTTTTIESLAATGSDNTLAALRRSIPTEADDDVLSDIAAPALARVDALAALENVTDPAELARRVAAFDAATEAHETGIELWNRLVDTPPPTPDVAGVRAEAVVAEAARTSLTDARSSPLASDPAERSRLDALVDRLTGTMRTRWIAYARSASGRISGPPDALAGDRDLEEIVAEADRFGITRDWTELAGEPQLEFNVRRARFHSFLRTATPDDDEAVAQRGQTFAKGLRDANLEARLPATLRTPLQTMLGEIDALADPNRPPSFDPDDLPSGPGSSAVTDWTYAGDDDFSIIPPLSLVYRHGPSGLSVAFHLVDEPAEVGPFSYLAVDEAPIELAAELLAPYEKELRTLKIQKAIFRTAPRQLHSWELTRGALKPASQWLERGDKGIRAGVAEDYYAPELRPLVGAPDAQRPLTSVPVEGAMTICALMGCRLPTVDEWTRGVALATADPPANLRDVTFKKQYDWIASRLDRIEQEGLADANVQKLKYRLPDQDTLIPVGQERPTNPTDDARALDVDDGELWFRTTDISKPGPPRNLIGNVWELVTTVVVRPEHAGELQSITAQARTLVRNQIDAFRVIGASALSVPPGGGNSNSTPQQLPHNPNNDALLQNFGAFPDLGFRPAFTLEGEFEPPLPRLMSEALARVPYFSDIGG